GGPRSPEARCSRSAIGGSISTAVSLGVLSTSTRRNAPYPGPISRVLSPRSTSARTVGNTWVSTSFAHRSELQHSLWQRFIAIVTDVRPIASTVVESRWVLHL